VPEPLDELPPADSADSAGSSGGPAGEEVLEAGATRTRPGRLRRDLLLAALLLALVGAVARAMSHHSSPDTTPTSGPSTSTASRSAPDTGSGLLNGSVVDPTGTVAPGAQDPFACPATYQCLESADAGSPAVTALRAAFPAAVLESASTVRLLSPHDGKPLWFRQLTARNGAAEILVRVDRAGVPNSDGRGTTRSGGTVVTYYQATLANYHVVVQVIATNGPGQALPPLQKLAADVRLLALS
jgi:hypothetical protein